MEKKHYRCPKTESIKVQVTELTVGTSLRDTQKTEDPSTGRSKGLDQQGNNEENGNAWTIWDD